MWECMEETKKRMLWRLHFSPGVWLFQWVQGYAEKESVGICSGCKPVPQILLEKNQYSVSRVVCILIACFPIFKHDISLV